MAVGVVIVDDEKVSREYIKGLIDWEKNGFSLIGEAQGSKDAMNMLANNDVNIVLLDVFMPGENGVVLSRRIAECYPSVAMIAISSYDNYDFVRQILKNGAHDYILKHRLNGEVLLSALKATSERMRKKQDDKADPQFRRAVEAWLFSAGRDPFMGDIGRVAVIIASVAWAENTPDELRMTIVEGILSILEEGSSPEQLIISVYYPPNGFIICTKFKSVISEAEIRGELYLRSIRNKNNIKLVYNLDFATSDNPILMERHKIPEYVRHHMTRTTLPNASYDSPARRHITMTINQQKQLLMALDERNKQATLLLIEEVYKSISDNDVGAQMIITKELLEILDRATREYGVQLDFMLNGKKLFEWAQNKSLQELSAKMIELYLRVIQEAKNQQGFSEYIKQANKFIDENYMHNIGLADVAKYIGVSESYLSRLYRQEAGMTFVEYLSCVRVNAAKGYLNNGMSIKEVTLKCGFRRYNYFFKVFKDYEGVTPKEYMNREVR